MPKSFLRQGFAIKQNIFWKSFGKNPYQNPPPFEKLIGDLAGAVSRRINIQHRLVYQVYEKAKTIKIIRMFAHYE